MSEYVRFYDLDVWRLGAEIVNESYKTTDKYPKEEKYSLVNQIRRSAVSICANIAEGYGRYHYMDKVKFYLNARGSLYELESHLILSEQLNFINKDTLTFFQENIRDLSVKLNNLIQKTRNQRGYKNDRY